MLELAPTDAPSPRRTFTAKMATLSNTFGAFLIQRTKSFPMRLILIPVSKATSLYIPLQFLSSCTGTRQKKREFYFIGGFCFTDAFVEVPGGYYTLKTFGAPGPKQLVTRLRLILKFSGDSVFESNPMVLTVSPSCSVVCVTAIVTFLFVIPGIVGLFVLLTLFMKTRQFSH